MFLCTNPLPHLFFVSTLSHCRRSGPHQSPLAWCGSVWSPLVLHASALPSICPAHGSLATTPLPSTHAVPSLPTLAPLLSMKHLTPPRLPSLCPMLLPSSPTPPCLLDWKDDGYGRVTSGPQWLLLWWWLESPKLKAICFWLLWEFLGFILFPCPSCGN
jgi:hypothetical protein